VEGSFLLTRSLASRLEEATGTSLALGVMIVPLGKGFGAPTGVPTFDSSVGGPWSDLRSRALIAAGVAMTPVAEKVANKKERKILVCILNRMLKIEMG